MGDPCAVCDAVVGLEGKRQHGAEFYAGDKDHDAGSGMDVDTTGGGGSGAAAAAAP
jgi:hypothetical protein